MEFKVLSKEDCEQIRLWRNDLMNALRTPYPLTKEQQEEFYSNTICNRQANARYWGVTITVDVFGEPEIVQSNLGRVECRIKKPADVLIGMAGIENIEWENARGEISLILSPEYRSMGNGDDAFKMLLNKGFKELNLKSIWGVCYECNPAVSFWERQINKYGGFSAMLPDMKYFDGKYWRGLYFSFERGNQ